MICHYKIGPDRFSRYGLIGYEQRDSKVYIYTVVGNNINIMMTTFIEVLIVIDKITSNRGFFNNRVKLNKAYKS